MSPVSAGAGIKFESTTDSGALLLLDAPAKSKHIQSKRHIVKYMSDNIENWLEFANADHRWGLDLKEQDIIFVSGTKKTSRWAVAAFQGNYRRKEGHVTGDFGPFASGGFSVKIEDQILPANYYSHGPRQPHTILPGGLSVTYPGYSQPSPPHPPNQTLFIHYYKMKRRLFLFKEPMMAAAGPHQLPPGPENPGMDAPMLGGEGYEFVSEQGLDNGQVCAHDWLLAQIFASAHIICLIGIRSRQRTPGLYSLGARPIAQSPDATLIMLSSTLRRKRRSHPILTYMPSSWYVSP